MAIMPLGLLLNAFRFGFLIISLLNSGSTIRSGLSTRLRRAA